MCWRHSLKRFKLISRLYILLNYGAINNIPQIEEMWEERPKIQKKKLQITFVRHNFLYLKEINTDSARYAIVDIKNKKQDMIHKITKSQISH